MPNVHEIPRALSFEEDALATLLLILGLLGAALGIMSPREHATELVLGLSLGALGLGTLRRRDRKRSSPLPHRSM